MAKDVHDFIDELARENEAFFSTLTERDTTYWPEGLPDSATAEALKPRWYNEIRGVEIIGRFIERVPDLTLKVMVGRQVGDEAKHAFFCRKRIEELGGSVVDFQPGPTQLAFGDFLDGLAFPEEFFAAQQFTVETQSVKRNEGALRVFDPETAEMFERHINPDERFHVELGILGLQVFARTSVAQDRARRAAARVRELHVAMVREHMERLHRGGYLK